MFVVFILLLFFVLPVLLIIGLMRPVVFSRLSGGKVTSRMGGTIGSLAIAIVLFFGAGMTVPGPESTDTTPLEPSSMPIRDSASAQIEVKSASNDPEEIHLPEPAPAQLSADEQPSQPVRQEVTPTAAPAPPPQPAPTPTQPSQSYTIKGNISRTGERIYHVPGGTYYDSTIIDTSQGERWFCSEHEAVSSGWRKSKR